MTKKFLFLPVLFLLICAARAQETVQYISYYPTPYASYNTINAGEVYVATAATAGAGQITANNLQINTKHVTGDFNMVYFSVINVPSVSVGGYLPAGSSGYGGGSANIGTLRVAGPLSLPSTILGKTSSSELHLIDGPVWGANIMPSPNAAKSGALGKDGTSYGMIWKTIKYLDTSNTQQTATFLAINDGGQAATATCDTAAGNWVPTGSTVCCPAGTNYFLGGACGTCVTNSHPNASMPTGIPDSTGCMCNGANPTGTSPSPPAKWDSVTNTCDCDPAVAVSAGAGTGVCCAKTNPTYSYGFCCPLGQTSTGSGCGCQTGETYDSAQGKCVCASVVSTPVFSSQTATTVAPSQTTPACACPAGTFATDYTQGIVTPRYCCPNGSIFQPSPYRCDRCPPNGSTWNGTTCLNACPGTAAPTGNNAGQVYFWNSNTCTCGSAVTAANNAGYCCASPNLYYDGGGHCCQTQYEVFDTSANKCCYSAMYSTPTPSNPAQTDATATGGVNNQGCPCPGGSVSVTYSGLYYCCPAVMPYMLSQGVCNRCSSGQRWNGVVCGP